MYLQVQVIDTGSGIHEDSIKKLFTAFGFMDEEKQLRRKGVGLGLNTSKQVIEKLGGKIKVESRFGHGSKFKFAVQIDQTMGYVSQNSNKSVVEDHHSLVYRWKPKIN